MKEDYSTYKHPKSLYGKEESIGYNNPKRANDNQSTISQTSNCKQIQYQPKSKPKLKQLKDAKGNIISLDKENEAVVFKNILVHLNYFESIKKVKSNGTYSFEVGGENTIRKFIEIVKKIERDSSISSKISKKSNPIISNPILLYSLSRVGFNSEFFAEFGGYYDEYTKKELVDIKTLSSLSKLEKKWLNSVLTQSPIAAIMDKYGFYSAVSHMLLGLSAGINRKVDFFPEKSSGSKGELGLKRGIRRFDNLLGSTISGDIGQVVVEILLRENDKLIGYDTDATYEELVADIDGYLLGDFIYNQIELSQVSKVNVNQNKLSEILEDYYFNSAQYRFNNIHFQFDKTIQYSNYSYLLNNTSYFAFVYLLFRAELNLNNILYKGRHGVIGHQKYMKGYIENALQVFFDWVKVVSNCGIDSGTFIERNFVTTDNVIVTLNPKFFKRNKVAVLNPNVQYSYYLLNEGESESFNLVESNEYKWKKIVITKPANFHLITGWVSNKYLNL